MVPVNYKARRPPTRQIANRDSLISAGGKLIHLRWYPLYRINFHFNLDFLRTRRSRIALVNLATERDANHFCFVSHNLSFNMLYYIAIPDLAISLYLESYLLEQILQIIWLSSLYNRHGKIFVMYLSDKGNLIIFTYTSFLKQYNHNRHPYLYYTQIK